MTIAQTLRDAFETGQQLAPFSDADPGFDLAAGYAAQRALTALRQQDGARVIGVKAGFTNTQIWDTFGIRAPIHGPVFDTSLATGPISTGAFMEPLIEPELVFRMASTPKPGMDDAALLACVEAIAPGFEIVHSVFPGWRFTAPDSVAAGAMHGALVIGAFRPATPAMRAALADFTVELRCDGTVMDQGHAANLLGSGPLEVLRHLIGLDSMEPLNPGDLVSTGTVTRALPIKPGQTWQASFNGLPLAELSVALT